MHCLSARCLPRPTRAVRRVFGKCHSLACHICRFWGVYFMTEFDDGWTDAQTTCGRSHTEIPEKGHEYPPPTTGWARVEAVVAARTGGSLVDPARGDRAVRLRGTGHHGRLPDRIL